MKHLIRWITTSVCSNIFHCKWVIAKGVEWKKVWSLGPLHPWVLFDQILIYRTMSNKFGCVKIGFMHHYKNQMISWTSNTMFCNSDMAEIWTPIRSAEWQMDPMYNFTKCCYTFTSFVLLHIYILSFAKN